MSEDDRAGHAEPPGDMLLVVGRGEADSLHVVRKRGDSLEVGALRAAEEGKPLHGELVRLSRRPEHPLLYDVDVLADARAAASGAASMPGRPGQGPPQVATPAYRANWETIFGGPSAEIAVETIVETIAEPIDVDDERSEDRDDARGAGRRPARRDLN